MLNNLPPWVKRLGLFGSVVFTILLFFQLAFVEILALEVQNYWSTSVRPFLFFTFTFNFTLYVWQIIIGVVLIICLIWMMSCWFRKFIRRAKTDIGFPSDILTPPVIKQPLKFNSSDVVTAIVEARNGGISREQVAEIIITAINFDIIQLETGSRHLEEFGFKPIYSGNGKYTIHDIRDES